MSVIDIDWTKCAAVETVPGRRGGQPVVVRSRVRPEELIENQEEGAKWLAESHGLPLEVVHEILAFYRQNKRGRVPHPA
jgi:uncharacterized protein (DUF433 family)